MSLGAEPDALADPLGGAAVRVDPQLSARPQVLHVLLHAQPSSDALDDRVEFCFSGTEAQAFLRRAPRLDEVATHHRTSP